MHTVSQGKSGLSATNHPKVYIVILSNTCTFSVINM